MDVDTGAERAPRRPVTASAIAQALLAVRARCEGDTPAAQAHLAAAQGHARATARRDRQLIEIAALIVADRRERAAGLAMVHAAEFPDDADLVGRLAECR